MKRQQRVSGSSVRPNLWTHLLVFRRLQWGHTDEAGHFLLCAHTERNETVEWGVVSLTKV